MAGNKKRLVVVESPTKAKTIRGFLPAGYQVAASMGHVRDLPESAAEIPSELKGEDWARLGVDVLHDFQPLYVVPASKKKVVSELRGMLRDADELVVATDEDREGESIGWHLVQVLKPKVPVSRIVFHEITEEAIRDALAAPRGIDADLVRAQETRRILDRLVGYTVSPLLWKKIAAGLSAGRVQSVAVRLLVQRERERRAFRSGAYWDLKALLGKNAADFDATLHTVDGKRVATGKDFDETTGRIRADRDVVLLEESRARALREQLRAERWKVIDTEERPSVRRPYPPFTTSTLQQEANRKLRLSARDTMRVAQRLYEEGFITYMRTDSVHLSQQAIDAARGRIRKYYGADYLSEGPRQFTTRSKGAQEAHEAIRPAGTEMRTAEECGLAGVEGRLYDLIWKRTVASQMAEARLTQSSATIEAGATTFRASGTRIDFPGFFRAYVEDSDDPEAALEDRDNPLPPLSVGDVLVLRRLDANGHETQPPARYTEATLVKTLESEGIGRPSTYASIIGTVIDRGYVERLKNQLVPTFTAFAVTGLLEKHFPTLVDTRFTARMEDELDEIAAGDAEWLPYLRDFFLGDSGLETLVRVGEKGIDPRQASTVQLEGLSASVRIGRFGPFVEMNENGDTVTASLPDGIPPADLSAEQVERLVRDKREGPTSLGAHPETGEPVYVLTGRFGPYVQLGGTGESDDAKPKRVSLPKDMKPERMDLEAAVALLSLPRTLGVHPETGEEVKAGIGRYGPYVVHGKDFRSLKGNDDVLTVGFDRAMELLSQPKAGSRSASALRDLGPHPADAEPVAVFQGRYGPYVKHGSVNATLPKDVSPESVTMDQAVALLAEKESRPGAKKAGRRGARATGGRAVGGTSAAGAGARTKSARGATAKKGTAAKTTKKAPATKKGGKAAPKRSKTQE
jgi:DNA topoisomerase I